MYGGRAVGPAVGDGRYAVDGLANGHGSSALAVAPGATDYSNVNADAIANAAEMNLLLAPSPARG